MKTDRCPFATPSDARRAGGFVLVLLAALALLAPGCSGRAQTAPEASGGSGRAELELPARYRNLLRAEMREIEGAMQELLGSLARGEAENGARLARRIEQSFVLRRELSAEERRELHALLPEEFLQLDRSFHGEAGALADALERPDFQAASESYAAMARACVDCHSRFAAERFPGFRKAAGAGGHGEGAQ